MLEDLKEMIADYAQGCFDSEVEVGSIDYQGGGLVNYTIPQMGLFNSNPGKVSGKMNTYAYTQWVNRLGGPPACWLTQDKCPKDLERNILVRLADEHREKKFLLRHKDDTIRAVLSDSYTRFDNGEFVDLLEEVVTQTSGGVEMQAMRTRVDDSLRTYLIMPQIRFDNPDNDSGGLHPAVYISNNEVGAGAARVCGGVYRSACSNGMICGWKTNVSVIVRHRYYNRTMLRELVAVALLDGFKISEEAAQKFMRSREVLIEETSLRPLITDWLSKYSLSVSLVEGWMGATRGNARENNHDAPRLFDVVNAATQISQTLNPALAEQLERAAGDLLAGYNG